MVLCLCCGKEVSASTARRHQTLTTGPAHLRGTHSLHELELRPREEKSSSSQKRKVPEEKAADTRPKKAKTRNAQSSSSPAAPSAGGPTRRSPSPVLPRSPSPGFNDFEQLENDHLDDSEREDGPPQAVDRAIARNARRSLAAAQHQAYVDDDDDDDDDWGLRGLEDGDESAEEEDRMSVVPNEEFEDDMEWEPALEGLTAEQRLDEYWQREVAQCNEPLTESDEIQVRAFNLKVDANLTIIAFKKMCFAFPPLSLPTYPILKSRMTMLSALQPILYDCCRNSCMAYTGDFAALTECLHCNERRYNADGRPVKRWSYLPIIPRLRAMWADPRLAKLLRYRHEYQSKPDHIADVYDGIRYRTLQGEHVKINGKRNHYKYFSSARDIALAGSFDGFSVFKKRSHTCWPTILTNLNLPPEIRHHLEHILSIGCIPGPKQMKDSDSFHYPLLEELIELAAGVPAWDASEEEMFTLHAFLIYLFGDIPAIAKLMRMKGHNALCPCRMCKIVGIRIPDSDNRIHYVPLDRSQFPLTEEGTAVPSYSAAALPLRSHNEMFQQAREVIEAPSAAVSNRLAKEYGIKGQSLWFHAPGISFPQSFPYDFMHIVFEDTIPNMIDLWSGKFKGLDEGTGSYHIPAHILDQIASDSVSAGDTIPSCFGCRVPHFVEKRSEMTAEAWLVWTIFISPVVLEGRWENEVYYTHFMRLVRLIILCLKFEYTRDDLREIRAGFTKWVEDYEMLYYQLDPSRVSACPLVIHGLLHIPDCIEHIGPIWTHWAFVMERYCGFLGRTPLSHKNPYPSLDRRTVEVAQIGQIKAIYHLQDKLRLQPAPTPESPTYPNYPLARLMRPSSKLSIERALRDKIAVHLSARYSITTAAARTLIPTQLTQWGKVRILEGGDTIHSIYGKGNTSTRDMTFVRYEQLEGNSSRPSVFYGQLHHILVLPLATGSCLQLRKASVILLGAISPCTSLRPGSLSSIHKYNGQAALQVVDLQTVQRVVGRVKVGNSWSIVDRTTDLACAEFIDDIDENNDDDAGDAT